MQTVTLTIGGMTCGGCANSISKVLTATAGVHSATVDWPNAAATIEYDGSQTDVAALIEVVENAGFDAQAA